MAKGEPVATPRINVGASIRDLMHDVRLIRSALEAQIERLECDERELQILLRAGAGSTISSGADPVANNLLIKEHADGAVEFAIDGGKSFTLGPRLAELFLFLASGDKGRGGADALAGWRSRTEIVAFLEKHSGKRITRNYVNGMVYLLKKALLKAQYDRNLIQSHRQKGVRLAYKRGIQGAMGTLASEP